MAQLLYPLALLACPVGMGLMMWIMMRGGKQNPAEPRSVAAGDEVARLRAEVDQLRAPSIDPSSGSDDNVTARRRGARVGGTDLLHVYPADAARSMRHAAKQRRDRRPAPRDRVTSRLRANRSHRILRSPDQGHRTIVC